MGRLYSERKLFRSFKGADFILNENYLGPLREADLRLNDNYLGPLRGQTLLVTTTI